MYLLIIHTETETDHVGPFPTGCRAVDYGDTAVRTGNAISYEITTLTVPYAVVQKINWRPE